MSPALFSVGFPLTPAKCFNFLKNTFNSLGMSCTVLTVSTPTPALPPPSSFFLPKFVWSSGSWEWGLPWSVVCPAGSHIVRESCLSLSQQPSDAQSSSAGVGPLSHLPPPGWGFVRRFELTQVLCKLPSIAAGSYVSRKCHLLEAARHL